MAWSWLGLPGNHPIASAGQSVIDIEKFISVMRSIASPVKVK